jgi:hypothetical protein
MYSTPIIINNFNRLTTTRKLVEDLSRLGYGNIHILDNKSTYPPLLDWYNTNPCTIKRLDTNVGNLAIYNSDYINEFKGWVAYTDSDVDLGDRTPSFFIESMVNVADKYGYNKVGLALRIDDLPDTDYANKARAWEQKYWERPLEKDVYEADVDTTFCIIKQGLPFQYQALRLGGDYTAIHKPWYLDYNNLNDEERYVMNHSSGTYSTTKRYVDSVSL